MALFDWWLRAAVHAAGPLKPVEVSSVALEIHPVEWLQHRGRAGEDPTRRRAAPAWPQHRGTAPGIRRIAGASQWAQSVRMASSTVHAVVSNQPGLTDILSRLHFPVSFLKEPAAGNVLFTRIASPLSTVRPPDNVIMQSVELSGMDAFEEVINVDDIGRIDDPLKSRLIEIARSHGELSALV
jgi:hypothetical protein